MRPDHSNGGASYRAVAAAVLLGLLAACSPPVSVKRVDAHHVHRVISGNEITRGEISRRTRNVLYTNDLMVRWEKDPAGALKQLHAALLAGDLLPESRVAFAELAFHHAEHGGGRPYYLASAMYAWIYLFPDDGTSAPNRYSPRLRLACDLYNRAVTQALKAGADVELRGGTMALPFGTLEVAFDPEELAWGIHHLEGFVPVAELEVTGFPTYYRWAGIGAPLAAGLKKEPGVGDKDLLALRTRVPVTALLRFSKLMPQLRGQRVQATLEVYPGYGDRTVTIAGAEVPLEAEPTAAMALTLSETRVWSEELTGFLGPLARITARTRLVSTRPYERGLIPVVFVHGTASSLARWVQLYNELDNDPRIHDHYQFWFFSYSTGNAIPYSAMLLRNALNRAITILDPDGHDPALRRMVVIGHSQGGLLTKAMVVDSGNRFWANVSSKSVDEMPFSHDTRELLQHALFFEPQPFVRRVIFLATPHHGSYVAGSWFAHQAARLVRAPLDMAKIAKDIATGNKELVALNSGGQFKIPTSVDNMTPGNPFVRTLAELPITPGVAAHSIIAIDDGVVSDKATDGVVQYASAHITGVESEIVVRSPHSCQTNPHTIHEVRRILLEHLEAH